MQIDLPYKYPAPGAGGYTYSSSIGSFGTPGVSRIGSPGIPVSTAPSIPVTSLPSVPTTTGYTDPTTPNLLANGGADVSPGVSSGLWSLFSDKPFAETAFGQGLFRTQKNGGGVDMRAVGTLLSGVGDLAGIYSAFQANKLSSDSLNFQKDAFERNFANQTQTYNTNLSDRAEARRKFAGGTVAERDAYITQNRI